ncbi:LOW QUALITY PROTEIN: ankyrin and armadillo repeat-containing protein [Leptosomus discolor]
MSSSWLASEDAIALSRDYQWTAEPVKKFHQVLRELAVGICYLLSIGSDANYHHNVSCQLPPAYIDTKIGQILISVCYMAESLGHTYLKRNLSDFEGTCNENINEDPTYNPNSTGGNNKVCFMQYAGNILFKLTLGTTEVELHENVFRLDVVNRFTNVIRSAEAY